MGILINEIVVVLWNIETRSLLLTTEIQEVAWKQTLFKLLFVLQYK